MPHQKQLAVHEGYRAGKDFTVMTFPLLIMSFFFYGPRVLLLALAAFVTAVICDRFSSMLKGTRYDKTENSSKFFALLIVLLMPANVPFYVVVSAVAVAVLIAKEAFGGYRSYPFNPAAVGACVAAVSWPGVVLRYPSPTMWMLQNNLSRQQLFALWRFDNAALNEGIYSALRVGGIPNVSALNLVLGNFSGPLGTASVCVLLACGVYLLARKTIQPATPAAFLLVCAAIAFFFPRISPLGYSEDFQGWLTHGAQSLLYEMLSGIIPFAAVFLVTEPGTLPRNRLSRIVYGALVGFATMMFNYFGRFELGACFALLLVNAISGYFDRFLAKGPLRQKIRKKAEKTPRH